MATLEQIDKTRSPKSVAIIMDGNGRWARQRGMDRSEGHKAGIDSLHDSIEAAKWAGVKYLTVYAFSTENWNRPQKEVDTLMNLIAYAVELETPDMIRKGVRLGMIGDFNRVPKFAMDKLKWSIEQTKDCQDITLIIALSYSARWELVDTMQRLARQCVEGAIKPEEIDQEMISRIFPRSEDRVEFTDACNIVKQVENVIGGLILLCVSIKSIELAKAVMLLAMTVDNAMVLWIHHRHRNL